MHKMKISHLEAKAILNNGVFEKSYSTLSRAEKYVVHLIESGEGIDGLPGERETPKPYVHVNHGIDDVYDSDNGIMTEEQFNQRFAKTTEIQF